MAVSFSFRKLIRTFALKHPKKIDSALFRKKKCWLDKKASSIRFQFDIRF